jgi:putative oxidoreductase
MSIDALFESVTRFYRQQPGGLGGLVLLLMRFALGIAFIGHGVPKLLNIAAWSASIGVPVSLGFLSASTMILGGGLIIVGLLTPMGAFFLASSMLVAIGIEILHSEPFVTLDPGGIAPPNELPSWEKATYMFLMPLVLIFIGPGQFSLDTFLARRFGRPSAQNGTQERRPSPINE